MIIRKSSPVKLFTSLLCLSPLPLILAGCGASDSASGYDFVKKPNLAVGKTFAMASSEPCLASIKSENIWQFVNNAHNVADREIKESKDKRGAVGGEIELYVNSRQHLTRIAQDAGFRNVKNLGIRDINVDRRGRHTPGDLNFVVLSALKTDTPDPIFKVRVINKACAGSELYVPAITIKKEATLVDFGH